MAPLVSYSTQACVDSFCPRATPVGEGRVLMLVLDRSLILVQFQEVLPQGGNGIVLQYQRLDFARSPELAGAEFEVPDLVGHWAAGVSAHLATNLGQLGTGQFGEYWIYHQGSPVVSGFRQHIFVAYARPLPSLASPGPSPAFSISCSDYSHINGARGCEMSGFPHTVGECRASFPFEAVGTSRLKVAADCGSGDRSFGTEFHLFKM